MKISNETKVGVLAAVSITILILGYNFLKGKDVFTKTHTFYAVYKKVDGLFNSNPVMVNGYKVGHVSSVDMNMQNMDIVVAISVPAELNIPKSSVLKITNNDLIGSKAVEIILGHDSSGMAKSGDTLLSQKDAGIEQALTSVLTPLSEKVNSVLSGIDTAIADVSLQKTLADFSLALRAFQVTTLHLNEILQSNSSQINQMVNNLNSVAADLKTSGPEFKSAITKLDQTAGNLAALDLNATRDELTKTLSELKKTLAALTDKNGSIGKLASSDAVYLNLQKTLTDINILVNDMIKYPRRYTGITEGQRKKGDRQKEVAEGIKLPTAD